MSWEFQDHLPIYAQLMDTLKRRIVTGRYLPGEKLPSVRELAAEAGINPNTVQRAFSELEREGLIYTQRATGKYVTENEADIKSAREALARTQVADFLRAMQSLGFSSSPIPRCSKSLNTPTKRCTPACARRRF